MAFASTSKAFSALFHTLDGSTGSSSADTSPFPDQLSLPSSSPTSPVSTFNMLPGSFLPLPSSTSVDSYVSGTGYDYYSSLAPSAAFLSAADPASNASCTIQPQPHPHKSASSLGFYGTAQTTAPSHGDETSSAHAVQCLPSAPKTTDRLDAPLALAAPIVPAVSDHDWAAQQQQPRDHAPFSINPAPVHPHTPHVRIPSSWPADFARVSGDGVACADESSTTSLVDSLLFGHAPGRRDELPSVSQQHHWTMLNVHSAISSFSTTSSSTASPSVTVSSTPCLTSMFGPALACDTSSLAASPAVGQVMNATVSPSPSSAWQLSSVTSDHQSLMFPLDSLMRPADALLAPTSSWIAPAVPSAAAQSPQLPASHDGTQESAGCLYASPSVLTCTSSTTATSVVSSAGGSSASPVNVFGNLANRTPRFPGLSLAAAIAFDATCTFPVSPTSTCSSMSPSDVYSFFSTQQSLVGYPTTPCPQSRHDPMDSHAADANPTSTSRAFPWPASLPPVCSGTNVFAELDTILASGHSVRGSLADALRITPPSRARDFNDASEESPLSSSPSTEIRGCSESSLSPAPSTARSSVSHDNASNQTLNTDSDSADEYMPSPSPSNLAAAAAVARPTRATRRTNAPGGAKTKPPPTVVDQRSKPASKSTSHRRARHRCPHPGCERVFCQLTHLRTHVRTHTGERPHVCPHPGCGQSFAQSGNLVTHMRGHTGEKPYICSVCNRAFAQLGNLRTHERMHSGDRPYRCIIDGCQSQFSQLGNLRTHQLRLHGIPRGSDLAGLAIVSLDRSIHAAATAAFRINRRGQVVSADAESDDDEDVDGSVPTVEEGAVPVAAEVKVENVVEPVAVDQQDEEAEVAEVTARVAAAWAAKAKPGSKKRKTRSAAAADGSGEQDVVKVKVEPGSDEIEQPAPKKRRRSTRRTTCPSDSLEPAIELPQPAVVPVSTPSAEPELQLVGQYSSSSRAFVPIMLHPHVLPPPAFQQSLQFPMAAVVGGGVSSQPLPPPPSVYVPNPLRVVPQPAFGAGYLDQVSHQAWASAQSTTAGGKYVPIAPAPSTSAAATDSLALPKLARAASSHGASGRKSPVAFMR